jgi:N,N-dimethylformamidase
VDGIHAYADKFSVKPGETINIHVSSDTDYTMQIYRLGLDPNTPDSDELMPGVMTVTTRSQQPIHPGSYIHVANGLAATNNLTALTLECWVRPFVGRTPSATEDFKYTGLITQCDVQNGDGYGLFVRFDADEEGHVKDRGHVAFYLGDGGAFEDNLSEVDIDFLDGVVTWSQLKWHHIVATWDSTTKTKEVWIDGVLRKVSQGTQSFTGPVYPGSAPLRLAALGDGGKADHFLNGDLAMPVIYNRALAPWEIQLRSDPEDLQPPALDERVLACWPLSEEQGDAVADISPYGRSGRIINHATWQIGGPSFDATDVHVPRFGNYDPTTDPTRGHGIRFASDDLCDCRWQVTQTYTVPATARSGIYVARLSYQMGAVQAYYHVTFIVQKPENQKRAPILLVCPTNTWLAYNTSPFQSSDVDVPQYSAYKTHQAYAPTYHVGLFLPQPAADPYATHGSDSYSHLTRATRFTQAWLDSKKYKYDVISDLDLHTTLDVLQNYRTVIIAGHSEYWSVPAYNGIKSYLSSQTWESPPVSRSHRIRSGTSPTYGS